MCFKDDYIPLQIEMKFKLLLSDPDFTLYNMYDLNRIFYSLVTTFRIYGWIFFKDDCIVLQI